MTETIIWHRKPCEACANTGFADKVDRGIFAMQPKTLLCPICKGRGWVKEKP